MDFTWNPAGQITARANSNTVYGPASQTFAYDALGRLTGANVGAATTWTLDDATNWNTRTVAGTPTTYSVNGRNQLTAVGATPVTYDNNFSISGGLGVNYTHDQAGRLTAADSTTLTYDPASRLYGVGSATRFLYAGAQIAGEYDAAGNLTVRHIPGPGLDDVVMSRGALAASRRWPLTDERGSVFAQTEGNSILAGVVEYDAYGASATPLGRFGYTGQPWLPQAAAYHYRARNYLPQVGRFMETDPIGYAGGANLFAYVGADPMNFTDPWGMQQAPEPDGGTWLDPITSWGDRIRGNLASLLNGGSGTGGGPRQQRRPRPTPAEQQEACEASPFREALADPSVQAQLDEAMRRAQSTPNEGPIPGRGYGSEFGFWTADSIFGRYNSPFSTNYEERNVSARYRPRHLVRNLIFIHTHQSPRGAGVLNDHDMDMADAGSNAVIARDENGNTYCYVGSGG